MKKPVDNARRLVSSLCEFTDEEAICLRWGRMDFALSLHGRAAPLLNELCRLAADPAVSAAVQADLEQLRARRRRNAAIICERRAQLLAESARIASARARLSRVLGAYRRRRGVKRLNAAV